jgi:putative transposase
VLGFQRSSCRYVARRMMVQGLLDDIRTHAAARPRFGYRRIHVLLRRGGWRVNHKRVYRIYRSEGLAVRRRKRKRMAIGLRTVLPPPTAPNQRWSMDFTLDTLASGRRFRTFNVVDDFTRECLAIEVDTSIGGTRVARVLERLLALRAR